MSDQWNWPSLSERRLSTLIELAVTGPEHFDMGAWFATPHAASGHLMEVQERRNVERIMNCGTTACLAGHAIIGAMRLGIDIIDEDGYDYADNRPAYGNTDVAAWLGCDTDIFDEDSFITDDDYPNDIDGPQWGHDESRQVVEWQRAVTWLADLIDHG